MPTPATTPRVGPKTLANPQPTGVGKRGWRGRKPPPRGYGGCAPKNIKIRGELPTLANPPRVGPKTLANPKPTGVGKWGGSRGVKPPWRGVWGVSPHKFKRGSELPTIATTPRVGPKTLANPQPAGVGKTGGPGGASPWRGVWGICPQNFQNSPFPPHSKSLSKKPTARKIFLREHAERDYHKKFRHN